MKNLIETLRASKNVFLNAEGDAIEKWKNLPHNKEGLDLFLKFNIAEIVYGNKKVCCTSNVDLIERIFEILGRKSSENLSFSSKRDLVMAYDLENAKIMSFSMKSNWEISSFIPISPKNIEILVSVLNNVLKKGKQKES